MISRYFRPPTAIAKFLKPRSLILAAIFGLLAGNPDPAAGADKPNIVILLCDDLGYGDLSCFGHPIVKSPNLDRLAAEGMKLTHCYASSPVCSPSRAGMMTGRNHNRLGIRDWISPGSGIYLRTNEVTVPKLLKSAGYRTFHAGKWHLNSRTDGSEATPGEHGFDYWFYTQNNAAPSHANPTNFIRNGQAVGPLNGYSSALVVDEALNWLDANGRQPFYLNLWFHETHEPVAAADEFTRLYSDQTDLTKADYYGDVSAVDHAIGRLLKFLDQQKLAGDTFVFFSSDNGPETFMRYATATRSHGSPGPLRGMKLHITEAGYRVPGIIRWPGHTRPGQVVTEPVCNLDLLPTVCEMAGIPLPADRALDGASILPIFSGKPVARKTPLYWQYDRAISLPWTVSMRDGPWKLLATPALDRFELYNLAEDTGESINVAERFPERVQGMAAVLKKRHAEIAAEGERSGNPPLPQRPEGKGKGKGKAKGN